MSLNTLFRFKHAEFEHDNPNPRTRDENGSEYMPNAKNLRGAGQNAMCYIDWWINTVLYYNLIFLKKSFDGCVNSKYMFFKKRVNLNAYDLH